MAEDLNMGRWIKNVAAKEVTSIGILGHIHRGPLEFRSSEWFTLPETNSKRTWKWGPPGSQEIPDLETTIFRGYVS